uniref:Putative secreted salivary gland peptide n=1 Tax=Ixodes ricinus TaxID=34613 RepID=A0A147BRF4_IXORI
MNVYFVKVAGLLVVMSFTLTAGLIGPSAVCEESTITEDPERQPVLCSVPPGDQQKILNCTSKADEAVQHALQNYTWLFKDNFTTLVRKICKESNQVFFNITEDEEQSLINLVLGCKNEVSVTPPPTATSSETEY